MRLTFSSPSIANGLVPLEAVILAGVMMTKFASHVFTGRKFDWKANIMNIWSIIPPWMNRLKLGQTLVKLMPVNEISSLVLSGLTKIYAETWLTTPQAWPGYISLGFEKFTTDKAPGGTLKPAENASISDERR